MKIVCVLSIIFVLLCLKFDSAQSQAYGGALSYKFIYYNNDTVKLRLLNKLVIKGTATDTQKCSSKCGELVDSQQLFITTTTLFDYLNTTFNFNQTSNITFDASFYCKSGYPTGAAANTLFISGKREFDVVLPVPKTKQITFKYKGNFIGNPVVQDYLTDLDNMFKLRVNLNNRDGQTKPNTPPNLEQAEVSQTFIANERNVYQIIVKDDDGDQIKCEYDVIDACDNTCIDIHTKFTITPECVLILEKDVFTTATIDPLILDIRISDLYPNKTVISSVSCYISINIVKTKEDLVNSAICDSRESVLVVNPFGIRDNSSALKSFTLLNILFVLVSIVYNNI